MPITLDEPTAARTPVLRRRRLGEQYRGLLVRTQTRDLLKTVDGVPQRVLKANGKPRQELVVTLLTVDSTMPAGLGDTEDVPARGDIVRAILKGGGYGAWIDADTALKPRQVGDLVTLTSDHAQVYDANGNAVGGHITDQAQVDAHRAKSRSVGIYGALTIDRPGPDVADLVAAAEQAYMDTGKPTVIADSAVDDVFGPDGDPFDL